MKVTIFGVGFVGLTQGAVLASYGHDVVCVDVDSIKIGLLQDGKVPFYEPDLEPLVCSMLQQGKITFTTDINFGVRNGEVLFIAVGTPSTRDGHADLSYVLEVARGIAHAMDSYKLLVNKSTVPLGTADLVTDEVAKILLNRGLAMDFDVASNPEFLKEGTAVRDCLYPDRIIIGTESERARTTLYDLYLSCVDDKSKIILMKTRSAELSKYAANTMLAAKISMINEISIIAERYDADIDEVRMGIGTDPRIGSDFINPGPGYGGSCFPKDVRALIKMCQDVDFNPHMIRSIEERNKEQKMLLFRKLYDYYSGQLRGKTISLWGLAFKANTSDMRESASCELIENLNKAGSIVKAYDPEAMNEAKLLYSELSNIFFCDTKENAAADADALIIVTEWEEFKSPDFALLHQILCKPLIIDGRNLYKHSEMLEKGFIYCSIGRK